MEGRVPVSLKAKTGKNREELTEPESLLCALICARLSGHQLFHSSICGVLALPTRDQGPKFLNETDTPLPLWHL